jgi:hypothetical protein
LEGDIMSIFEAGMLICFGAAWPLSIHKSFKSKNNSGKSLFFLFVILTGYLSGIINKLFYNYDHIIFLYVLNFVMVFVDILLFYRNKYFVK